MSTLTEDQQGRRAVICDVFELIFKVYVLKGILNTFKETAYIPELSSFEFYFLEYIRLAT